MLERILPSILAFVLSAVGLALRASRRSRTLGRIGAYNRLADDLQEHDPQSAARVRNLATRAVSQFVEAEQASLDRRLDPYAVFTWLLLVVPAAGVFVWAWTFDSRLKWPVILFTGLWALVWGGFGWTQLWKAHDEGKKPDDA